MDDALRTDNPVEGPSCDFHRLNGLKEPALYDALTTEGVWAYLCQNCFDSYGISNALEHGIKLEDW